MSHINVTINGRQYRMACEEGQEVRLLKLAESLEQSIDKRAAAQHAANLPAPGLHRLNHIFRHGRKHSTQPGHLPRPVIESPPNLANTSLPCLAHQS